MVKHLKKFFHSSSLFELNELAQTPQTNLKGETSLTYGGNLDLAC